MPRITKSLRSQIAREMNARRRTRAGGRPKKLTACPRCGMLFGARDLQKHLPIHRSPKLS